MLADRPPIVGNQTGMDSFVPGGGAMGGHIGNQTELSIGANPRTSPAQVWGLGGTSGIIRGPVVGGNTAALLPGEKDEVISVYNGVNGDAAASSVATGSPSKSGGLMDGHIFLVLAGIGLIALVAWGR